ncbi:putative sterigmatocystin 8-O-methyltransferase precursor [Boeremia exigua]|uniref:putative sterigmatocystin 8-O-methyltransferase precursor n=1 Tax=Boeremia exigua TaxID=749465 RepID=UPI001E8CF434|nr:putative sterigmatocystin 8-O-methyltransferase precursor [Boeremia exigua]KAH6644812.1 putative sterigmatocystin 8-O-methyltransferase precursor [Boeremia exigua]
MTSQPDPYALLAQLQLLAADPKSFFADDAQKRAFQTLARQAAAAVEEPFETMQRLVYGPLPLVTARIAQDRGIFRALADSDGGAQLDDIAKTTGLPAGVLESLLDYLCTQDMAAAAPGGLYTATPLTHMLLAPLFADAVTHFHDNCAPAFLALNQVLSTPGANKTAFQTGHHTPDDFYTWMETHPVQQGAFHRFMEAQFASLPSWLDVVPFAEVVAGAGEEEVVFVDVGGGNGSQCAALRRAVPELRGRMILQDRKAVLGSALEVPGVEKMEHDFMREQPVRDARAYYLRQILHNHPDDTCIHILQMHLPALLNPASRLYIDDKVLPDVKAGASASDPPGPSVSSPSSSGNGTGLNSASASASASASSTEYTAALSLAMKAMFDAQERRESHWRWLVDQAGMEVVEIRRFSEFFDSVIVLKRRVQDQWR